MADKTDNKTLNQAAAVDHTASENAATNNQQTYRIKDGDTLGALAAKLGIRDWHKIGDINNINTNEDARGLQIGQEIILPPGYSLESLETPPTPKGTTENPEVITIEATETKIKAIAPNTIETTEPAETIKDIKEPADETAHFGIIAEILTQNEPLGSKEYGKIQSSLTELGFAPGIIDSYPGGNTNKAILEFLKTEEAEPLLTMIGNPAQNMLNSYGTEDGLNRIIISKELPDTHLVELEYVINDFLSEDNPDWQDRENLKAALNGLGYLGDIEDISKKDTSEATMKYLEDNPELMLTTHTKRFREMMQNEQTAGLRDLAQKTEGFDDRIKGKLKEMGDVETAHSSEVYKIQTILDLGGYKPGGIDGTIGNRTRAGIHRFKLEVGLIKEQPFKIAKFFEDASKVPEIGTMDEPTKNHDDTTNGYGVSDLAIERVFAGITGNELMDKGTRPADSAAENPRPLVVIDLGHGSDINSNDKIDPGMTTSGPEGFHEIHAVDPLGQALAEKLHSIGYQVVFTRNPGEQLRIEGNYNTTLAARPLFAHEMAQELNANGVIFLSLHADSAENTNASGTRLYVQGGNEIAQNDNSQALADKVGQNYAINNKGPWINQSDYSITRGFEKKVTDNDEISAGLILEVGFMSNKEDLAKLKDISQDPAHAAAEIANGLNEFVLNKVPSLRSEATAAAETPIYPEAITAPQSTDLTQMPSS